MIARINGILIYKSIDCVIIDINGIGYRVFVPLSTFYVLPDTGQPVILSTYTYLRKDSISLFGFYTAEEKEVFQLMLLVSGIGPKLAMNILSGISAKELVEAVSTGNLSSLVNIPGVGKKTAERMILELKDKIIKLKSEEAISAVSDRKTSEELMREDALSALINLGYKRNAVSSTLDSVMDESSEESALEVVLKKVLKILSH